MIKALLFDAYGTLFDTKEESVKATAKIFSHYADSSDKKLYLPDYQFIYAEWKTFHKNKCLDNILFMNEKAIFAMGLRYLYKKYNIKGNADNDVKIMLKTLYNRNVYSEVNNTLHILKNKYKIVIASNTDTKPLLYNIKKSKLCVDRIFTSEMLRCYKPNKEFYLTILEKIKIKPYEAYYIGDSVIEDIVEPQKLGIKAIWINRKNRQFPNEYIQPYYTIQGIVELLQIV